MKHTIFSIFSSILLVLVWTSSGWAQACDSGAWSLTNQQPSSCVPYTDNGIFWKKLPNAGNGGPVNNLTTNSAAIVNRVITDAGSLDANDFMRTTLASPGLSEWVDLPIYYGRASDPIYRIPASACLNNTRCGIPGSPTDVRETYWHIPNRARWSGLGSSRGIEDQFMIVWDQTNNKVLLSYVGGLTFETGTLPHCTATSQATACPIPVIGWAQRTDYTSSKDHQIFNPSGYSLNSAGLALIVRQKEWMNNDIRHALYLNSPCEGDGEVFPALPGAYALLCSTSGRDESPTLRPKHGSLFFLDYTDAQIAAMNLPAWQQPLVRALAHYGGYHGDTIGPTIASLQVSRFEGGTAYEVNGTPTPLYSWLENQGIKCFTGGSTESPCRYSLGILANIPPMTGPACPTVACGVEKHLHIADECIPKGLAGLPGGCGTTTPAPPVTVISPPKNLRIIESTQ